MNRKVPFAIFGITIAAVLIMIVSVSASASPIMPPDWSPMHGGTGHDLHGVWGSSGSDVFAVGDLGTILHYNGRTWSTMNSGTTSALEGVWGSSPNDVFAVGLGTILHYNGSTWSALTTGSVGYLTDVWGSSGSDVFAVGSETILHHPGHFTTTSAGVNWGLVGRIIAAVALVGTVFTALWLIDRRGRGKTIEDK